MYRTLIYPYIMVILIKWNSKNQVSPFKIRRLFHQTSGLQLDRYGDRENYKQNPKIRRLHQKT